MNEYYVDLHIHIGRTERDEPVKISGSRNLTFYNIAREASDRKGIEVIGIIDSHSPAVQRDIVTYLERGEMEELQDGGIRFHQTTILLGSEIEVKDPDMGPVHVLAYLPTLQAMQEFTDWMSSHMTNVSLSSQRLYVPAIQLQEEVIQRGGLFIPAHIFSPHRSMYGSGSTRMAHLFDLSHIHAVELGLSADSEMAGLLSELDEYTFVTDSDAHSLAKIGREYNSMLLAAPSFAEVAKALARQEGRKVTANYGLNPSLGKYHRTFCRVCQSVISDPLGDIEQCPTCGSFKIVRGVADRIRSIADRTDPRIPSHRPPYHYQVPLEFIPGMGKRKISRLLEQFGTEMNIIHRVPECDLANAAGEETSRLIVRAREGTLPLTSGGGGIYGKVKLE